MLKLNVYIAVSLSKCYLVNKGTWNNVIEVTLSSVFHFGLQDIPPSLSQNEILVQNGDFSNLYSLRFNRGKK